MSVAVASLVITGSFLILLLTACHWWSWPGCYHGGFVFALAYS